MIFLVTVTSSWTIFDMINVIVIIIPLSITKTIIHPIIIMTLIRRTNQMNTLIGSEYGQGIKLFDA